MFEFDFTTIPLWGWGIIIVAALIFIPMIVNAVKRRAKREIRLYVTGAIMAAVAPFFLSFDWGNFFTGLF